MKKYQLITLCTALFVVLFYDENIGLNLSILAFAYALLTFFATPEKLKTKSFFVLFSTSIFSAFAFAWFGDFASFLAVFSSLFLLDLKSKSKSLKSIFIIPVLITNFFTFLCRFFKFEDWIPMKSFSGTSQKIISVILIPAFFFILFFGVYSYGSDHFAKLFTDFELNLNFFQFTLILLLGFFIAFNYWNLTIHRFIFKRNFELDNHFSDAEKIQQPTYSFLDIQSERTSGVMTFLALNVLLVIFIITFNYEQFVEIQKSPNQLSEETHERVNAVIMSIVMAIVLIMFYFKSGFNFDPKAQVMKLLAKIWIFLNAVLVFSAMAKNAEYFISYGLTYKRLGVVAFLTLSLIGLVLTFVKIQQKKTNAYLFNQMFWYFYGMILVCSYVNWGGLMTAQNMKRNDFAVDFHQTSVSFSEKQLLKYAEKRQDSALKTTLEHKIKQQQNESFLSGLLYYKSISVTK